MSFVRGLVQPVPTLALLALSGLVLSSAPAGAGELDACRRQVRGTAQASPAVEQVERGYAFEELRDVVRPFGDDLRLSHLDRVPLADLRAVEDFHPETDRWTEHNNRIRITWWNGGWFFSNELDIQHDFVTGLRLAWEVPGFIGIRLDSGFVPWSRLEVKGIRNGVVSSRSADGVVHAHTLSLGIFNPELSVDGLAFWAGFGGGVWVYNYNESDVFSGQSGIDTADASFDDVNISGCVFVELDYKIADIFHVGVGIRQHFILASHTDDGRFYSFDGTEQSTGGGRNDGILDDLAGVTELTFNLSVLF